MKKNILVLISFLYTYSVICQVDNSEMSSYIENITEQKAISDNQEIDIESLVEDLEYYYRNPLNLNTASEDELQRLWILNDFQIKSLLDYRNKVSKIVSLYELPYLFGFDHKTVELIKPFVYLGNKEIIDSIKVKKLIQKSRHEFIARSSFNPGPQEKLSSGIPASLYFRFLSSYYNKIKIGLIAENDKGEDIRFSSKQKGFDFYSGHIELNLNKVFSSIVVGDYRVKYGQGLLIWNGFGSGKSSEILATQKRGQGIRGNSSKNESDFFRGAAIFCTIKDLSLSVYASKKSLDALYGSVDNKSGIKTIYTDGYHRDSAELSKRSLLSEITLGSRLGFKNLRTNAGINFLFLKYDKPLLPSENLYQAHQFTGDNYMGISLDYKLMMNKMQIFGESAYNSSSLSTINGVNFLVSENFGATILYRNIPSKYYSPYSGVFSENSRSNNENGTFLSFNWNTPWSFNLSAYSDIFTFPWASYNADGQSHGTDYQVQLVYNNYDQFKLTLRYKRKIKEKNLAIDGKAVNELHSFERESFRVHLFYKLSDRLWMSNRFEWCQSGFKGIKYNPGYLLYQDISFQLCTKVAFRFRYAFFDVKNYYSRIYAYEHDVLYAYSMPIYYGSGQKIFILARINPNQKLSLWFRYEFRDYTREEPIKEHGLRAQLRLRY